MKLMKLSVLLMGILTAMLTIGSIIMGINHDFKFYVNPVFISVVIVFLVIQVLCLVKFRFRLKKIGFYLCHIGLVVLIVGSLIGYLGAQEVNFNIPIDPNAAYSVVQKSDGTDLDFGFNISVTDFSVEKYPADYEVYKPDPTAPDGYSLLIETVYPDRNGNYYLGKDHGTIAKSSVVDETGYREMISTPDDLLMVKIPQADKQYEAQLKIIDDKTTEAPLLVNHPYTHKGWKFYLMDYDKEGGNFVSLYVKNDPGNQPIRVAIWLMLIGTVLMCFKVFEQKGEA